MIVDKILRQGLEISSSLLSGFCARSALASFKAILVVIAWFGFSCFAFGNDFQLVNSGPCTMHVYVNWHTTFCPCTSAHPDRDCDEGWTEGLINIDPFSTGALPAVNCEVHHQLIDRVIVLAIVVDGVGSFSVNSINFFEGYNESISAYL